MVGVMLRGYKYMYADSEIIYTLNKFYHFHPPPYHQSILEILFLPVNEWLRLGTDEFISSLLPSQSIENPPVVGHQVQHLTS